MVFIARPASATTNFTVLKTNVLNLLSRAKILETGPAVD
jgi:RNase P protein component